MKKTSTAAKQSKKNLQGRLTIGLDLGDRWSWYCMLNEAGEVIGEQKVGTTPKAMKEGFGGTVEDGDFNVVEVDENVVDAVGVGGGEKVFGGREKNALLHEACGVADAGDVVAVGLDMEIVEVDAAENYAGIRGSRLKTEFSVDAGV